MSLKSIYAFSLAFVASYVLAEDYRRTIYLGPDLTAQSTCDAWPYTCQSTVAFYTYETNPTVSQVCEPTPDDASTVQAFCRSTGQSPSDFTGLTAIALDSTDIAPVYSKFRVAAHDTTVHQFCEKYEDVCNEKCYDVEGSYEYVMASSCNLSRSSGQSYAQAHCQCITYDNTDTDWSKWVGLTIGGILVS